MFFHLRDFGSAGESSHSEPMHGLDVGFSPIRDQLGWIDEKCNRQKDQCCDQPCGVLPKSSIGDFGVTCFWLHLRAVNGPLLARIQMPFVADSLVSMVNQSFTNWLINDG